MADKMTFRFSLGGTLASSFRGMTQSAQKQIVGLGKSVRTLENSQVGRLGAGLEKSRAQVVGLGAELKNAQGRLGALQARAAASGGASASLARQIKSAQSEVKTLSGRLDRSKRAFADSASAAAQASGSVKRLRNDYRALSGEIDKARQKQQRLTANLAAREANKSRRAEARAGLFDAVALGATVAVPAKISIDFERSIARAAGLARASEQEQIALTEKARDLGRKTMYTASQAAEGMQYLAMAGFDVNETIAAMPGMLNLALAGATDLGRTADIASNILSGFKIPAQEMDRVSDVLVAAFTTSNTTLETLGETMKYVAPVASALGVSVEEAASMAGFLGSVGIQGSMAGTSLRAALLRLSAPPKQAADALRELGEAGDEELTELLEDITGGQQALEDLGIATKDAAGNMRSFVDILEDINNATSKMGSGDRIEAINKIFGTRASAGMVELLNKAGSTVDKNGKIIVDATGKQTTALRAYIAQQENAAGTAQRFANRVSDTTHGSLIEAKSALEDTAIALGNLFSPGLRKGAAAVRNLANGVTTLVERFPRASGALGTALLATISLAVASKALAYGYTFVKGGLLLAEGALIRMTGAQVANDVVTKRSIIMQKAWAGALAVGRMAVMGVTLATRAMNLVMRANPLGLALTAVAAIAGVIVSKFGLIGRFVDWLGKKYDQWFGDGESIDIGDSTSIDATQAWDRDKSDTLAGSSVESMAAQAADNLAKFNFDDSVAGAEPLADFDYSGLGAGAMSINVEMPVSVEMGLDSAAFKSKLLEHRPELESYITGLMRKIMEELAHENRRTSYAY